jgi:hypothetical protein
MPFPAIFYLVDELVRLIRRNDDAANPSTPLLDQHGLAGKAVT